MRLFFNQINQVTKRVTIDSFKSKKKNFKIATKFDSKAILVLCNCSKEHKIQPEELHSANVAV